ncbi:MAG TPA: alpha/beta fold hydrolase [Thermodesulfobacteriota bacterium]
MPAVEVGGRSLAYLGGPSGDPRAVPLVCIHGAGGAAAMWPQVHVAFRDERAVYALDLPGHGRSAPLDGRITLDRYADTVTGFLDAVGIERAVVVGHSMGGGIALSLALEAPGRVAGLVLVGTGAKLGVAPETMDLLERDPDAAVERICRLAYGPAASEAMLARAIAEMRKTPSEVLRADFRACQTFDVRGRLGEIGIPALVLVGEADVLTPPRFAAFLADHIAGAALVVVPGVGHMLPVEAPGAFASAVRPFVRAL